MKIKYIAATALTALALSTTNSFAERVKNDGIANIFQNFHTATSNYYDNFIGAYGQYKGDWIRDRVADLHADYRYGEERVDQSESWIENDTKHAWADGNRGQGVNIGIVDYFHGECNCSSDWWSHGALVSSIAGGENENLNTVGIAGDANINKYHGYVPTSLGHALRDNDVVNVSIGSTNSDLSYLNQHRNEVRNLNGGYTVSNALRIAGNTDAVVTVAAGNDGANNIESGNRVAFYIKNSDLADQTLVVGAIDDNNVIKDYSNRAGQFMNDFVVDKATTLYRDSFTFRGVETEYTRATFEGTSLAAPRVAGKIALIRGKFDNLNATQTIDLVKRTADDLGAPGVDNIYGHGKINLTRALSPVGTIR